MGWTVVGYITIEMNKEPTRATKKKIKDIVDDNEAINWWEAKDFAAVEFELSGNKAIDYSFLEDIKQLLEAEGIVIAIRSDEYAETEGGYFYETKEADSHG